MCEVSINNLTTTNPINYSLAKEIYYKRHGQFPGMQSLTFDLKMLTLSEILMFLSKDSVFLDLEKILFLNHTGHS